MNLACIGRSFYYLLLGDKNKKNERWKNKDTRIKGISIRERIRIGGRELL
jgi:hypothetical protein